MKKTFLLCILDGFGIASEGIYNAVANASTPCLDYLLHHCPNTLLDASGEAVGLPIGQMGNSEVGHITIGAGRRIYQWLARINKLIESGEFKRNDVLLQLIEEAKIGTKVIHLLGLCSNGGVHAHIDHIKILYDIFRQSDLNVKVHVITDGRDCAPQSAPQYLDIFDSEDIMTVSGRYFAMDRDNNWDRTDKAFEAIMNATSKNKFKNSSEYIMHCYTGEGITDEFIPPAVSINYHGINDGDILVFANYRADRAIQIMSRFAVPQLEKEHKKLRGKLFSMTNYSARLKPHVNVLVDSVKVDNTLGEIIAHHGLTQLRIAETEKYAHVTFFFNGGKEKQYPLEDRILIPSPKVTTYDIKPEMSALQLTTKLTEAIESRKYDFICANFANADMVGHTGNYNATVKAIETIDKCLDKIIHSIKFIGGQMLITADHGNAEIMADDSGAPITSHSLSKVPLIYIGEKAVSINTASELTDIAPLVLRMMDLPIPEEMS